MAPVRRFTVRSKVDWTIGNPTVALHPHQMEKYQDQIAWGLVLLQTQLQYGFRKEICGRVAIYLATGDP